MKTQRKALILFLTLLAMLSVPHRASAYYDPSTQRWLNRDPLGDTASLPLVTADAAPWADYGVNTTDEELLDASTQLNRNLYGAFGNNPASVLDAFGLSPSLNPANQAAAAECMESAAQAGARNLARQALRKEVLKQGAKSYEQWLQHAQKLKAAQERLAKLKRLLDQTKGPKAREPVKEAIEKLGKEIQGHVKEIGQKWPKGCPPQ